VVRCGFLETVFELLCSAADDRQVHDSSFFAWSHAATGTSAAVISRRWVLGYSHGYSGS